MREGFLSGGREVVEHPSTGEQTTPPPPFLLLDKGQKLTCPSVFLTCWMPLLRFLPAHVIIGHFVIFACF